MRLPRTDLVRACGTVVTLLLACLLLTACGGSGGDDDSSGGSGSSGSSAASSSKDTPEPGSTEAAQERLGGDAENAGGFAETPELVACLKAAGFTSDAPPHGALAAYRGPDGARAVVATDSGAALEVAGMVGTAKAPAEVDGRIVVTGSPKVAAAASDCLAGA